ncbi:MAG: hypothetical protein ACRCTQ_02875 [Brevinemataceae bacterium]
MAHFLLNTTLFTHREQSIKKQNGDASLHRRSHSACLSSIFMKNKTLI